MTRAYLDWNATAPLRPQAREAMLAAMDAVGNPSSVHAEGRAAKAIIETARGQVAALVGCEPDEVVFTSGATEAIATVAAQSKTYTSEGWNHWVGATEHDAVYSASGRFLRTVECSVNRAGLHRSADIVQDPDPEDQQARMHPGLISIIAACGETGVLSDLSEICDLLDPWENRDKSKIYPRKWLCDTVQCYGKVDPWFNRTPEYRVLSGHKLGSSAGVGCLIVNSGETVISMINGGGQEQGRRSGTENVIGIAGFGAAAQAAQRDIENGVWDRVAELRDRLEERLEAAAPDLIVFGREAERLPNTSYFAIPGWRGETQVMQMDLAGFAISAGSACSSGKVGASRVLLAMGFDAETAASAIRV
ncbi:MAG: aminotransferase class V-fold PLP-dependent enzyme, partial [Proteobacteria bacterium]|nr:aminotransferase class V-fold PLP-dependent enzyme [Pseudomonadota bacterium]